MCALLCGICVGMLKQKRRLVSQQASWREEAGQNCATYGPEMDSITRDPSQRAQEDFHPRQQAGKHDRVICVGRELGRSLTAPPRGRSEVQHEIAE